MSVHIPEAGKDKFAGGVDNFGVFWISDLRARARGGDFPVFDYYCCVGDGRLAGAVDQRAVYYRDLIAADAGNSFGHFVERGHFVCAGASDKSSESGFVAFADGFEVVELGIYADFGDELQIGIEPQSFAAPDQAFDGEALQRFGFVADFDFVAAALLDFYFAAWVMFLVLPAIRAISSIGPAASASWRGHSRRW